MTQSAYWAGGEKSIADRAWLVPRSSITSWKDARLVAEERYPGSELVMVEIANATEFRLYVDLRPAGDTPSGSG